MAATRRTGLPARTGVVARWFALVASSSNLPGLVRASTVIVVNSLIVV